MDVVDNKSRGELVQSLLAEIAKSKNELQCAKNDIEKAQNRIDFCIVVANKLIEREETNR